VILRKKRESEIEETKKLADKYSKLRGYISKEREVVSESKRRIENDRMDIKKQIHFKKNGMDMCFIMDCTGSMAGWIKAAKENVLKIQSWVRTEVENVPIFRLAFVGYRDFGDEKQLEVKNFTEDSVAMQNFITGLEATGGNDTPEDVAGAFNEANKLSWKYDVRLVIHFGDAPCHGKRYHTCDDNYPDGDKFGRVPEELLLQMAKKSIKYYFIKIHERTDQMQRIFRTYVCQNAVATVKQFDLGSNPAQFMESVVVSVANSLGAFNEKFPQDHL